MPVPKRLPKSEKELGFDKLMRNNRPSVWEDKGMVADQGFKSLKQSARTNVNPERKLEDHIDPPPHEPSGSMDPDDIELPARKPVLPHFDSFMRETKRKSKKIYGMVQREKKPDHELSAMTLIHRGLTDSQPKWQAVSKSDYALSEKNHGLGCSLARHEYESKSTLNRYNNMKTVKQILAVAKLHGESPEGPREDVRLPAVAPGHRTTAKNGPGYIRMDYSNEDTFLPFHGLRKPAKPRRSMNRDKAEAARRLEQDREKELLSEFEQICARKAAASEGGSKRRHRS